MSRPITLLLSLATAALAFTPSTFAQLEDRPGARNDFEPSWESLNARRTPEWYRDAKLGIFIHWGVYSVPAYCHTSTYSEWYLWWLKTNSHGGMVKDFHERNYGTDFAYRDFAGDFRAELWDPTQWAELFDRAGAKFVVLVSKHHDGFALWPEPTASKARGYPWNSTVTGPKRDLCGELAEAVRRQGLRMGFYFSFMEWDNPLYVQDEPDAVRRYVDEMMIPQIQDLVTRYRPAVFWPDGEWNLPDTSWRSTEILDWIYDNCENPEELVVNDRWGRGLRGQVGDYYTTEYGSMGNSQGIADESKPFEECRGIGHSFALNRLENLDAYLGREELIQLFVDIVSKGGNLLLNLGPTADGRIPVIQQDRLVALGDWLEVNGEAIYGTRASRFGSLPWGRSTTKGTTLYLHVFDWPKDGRLEIPGLMSRAVKARLLHDPAETSLPLHYEAIGRPEVDLTGFHPFPNASVIALEFSGAPQIEDRILPEADGSILLSAERAELTGGLRLEHGTVTRDGVEEPRTNVGYWANAADTVSWDLRLETGRTYDLELEYGSKPGTEGSEFVVEIGELQLPSVLEKDTGDWHVYRTMPLGRLLAMDSAEVTVRVRCTKLVGEAVMNLRSIRLTPIE